MEPQVFDENEQGECLLSNDDGNNFNNEKNRLDNRTQWIRMGCAVIASLVLGYVLGHSQIKETDTTQFGLPGKRPWYTTKSVLTSRQVPAGSVLTTWEHNLTFTQRPSPESEAAWGSIIPIGRGFVHHAKVAPFISNIAVFHQLHCLVSYNRELGCPISH